MIQNNQLNIIHAGHCNTDTSYCYLLLLLATAGAAAGSAAAVVPTVAAAEALLEVF